MNVEKEHGLLWTRVILETYNKLPQMARTLEKAGNTLIKSSLTSGSYGTGYTTEEIFEKMIELNYRKTGIINLKVLTDQAIKRIEPSHARVLQARFFLKLDFATIAEKEKTAVRTVFRKIERGIEKLYDAFVVMGFSATRLDVEYENEPLIQRVLMQATKKDESEQEFYSKSS